MPLYQPNDIILNGKYKIEKLLGTGAFGEVYLATHVELNVKRAVKVLHRQMPGAGTSIYTEYLERFRQEAQIGARLPHENLVQVHDFEQAEDSLHLVMEYAQGGSLGEKLQTAQKIGQPITVEESIEIIKDITKGLAVLHENQIVHRDLKPNNILLDKKGHAKVADLGLAQIPGGASMRSRFSSMAEEHPGTPAYMSPEQENTNKVLRPSSDIYALGLMWFEILSGKNYNLLMPGTPITEFRTDVEDEVKNLIAEMLEKDHEKRPWDGTKLLVRLQKIKQAQEQEKQRQAEQQQEEQKQQQKKIEEEQQLQRERKEREEDQRRQEKVARQKQEEDARLRQRENEGNKQVNKKDYRKEKKKQSEKYLSFPRETETTPSKTEKITESKPISIFADKRKYYLIVGILLIGIIWILIVNRKPTSSSVTPTEPEVPSESVASAEPATSAEPAATPAAPDAPAAPAEETGLVTWFQYDQNNEDPASDERVGNQWLRDNIPLFDAAYEGKYNWNNIPKAWDKMISELIAAEIAGGEVPDLIELGGAQIVTYVNNDALLDLTEWMMAQDWYADLDESAKLSCTAPDGRFYCVPTAERPHLTYVWADHYPNGYPTTPEQFLVEAERLKGEGIYAWTYFGSTAYGGSGSGRGIWALIASFGGTYDDGQGNMLLNTPENVAAIEFLRETVIRGYNPETVFAGGFVEEDSFKDSSAGAIPTGLFGYRYIYPLTAPDGTKYETGTSQDMIDAIAAGDVIMRPMFALEGKTPGCNLDIQGVGIPASAKNLDAAYDFINWIMTDQDIYIKYVLGPGAGFPSLKSAQALPEMQTPFYQQAAIAINASVCRNWAGSLERPSEAAEAIMNAIYKLIKESQTADIATELQKVQNEYNANN